MRLSSALRSTLGLGVLCGAIALPATPALAVGPVIVVGDTANAPNWYTQLVHMATITADDLQRYKQIELEIQDADQELTKIGSLSFNASSATQLFGSYALGLNERYPTVQASLLADSMLNAQHGTVSAAVISSLGNDLLNAKGNLSVNQALGNIVLAQLAQDVGASNFAAAQQKQNTADGVEAAGERSALLDLNSKDPTAGMLY